MMDKIKVLHVLYELMPSGAETMLYSAYPYWNKRCRMTILATGPSVGVYAKTLKERGYEVDYLPIEEGVPAGKENKIKKIIHLVKFYHYLKRKHYDVVHIHKESLSENYIQLAKRAGVSLCVRTVHNNFRFEGELRKKKADSRKKCQSRYGAKYIAISDGVMENEKQVFDLTCDYKIYNWCNNEKYDFISGEVRKERKNCDKTSDKLVVISTGNCSKVKNHELLIRAISQMEYKDNILYYHIGCGKDEVDYEISLAQELNLTKQIRFEGFTDPLPYLEKSDVYVMPSLFEGLSIAAIEAATTGMHLLLADTPGTSEFRDKGLCNVRYFHLDTKVACSRENVVALARELDSLVEEYQKGLLVSKEAQSIRAKELYSAQVGAEKYLDVYLKGLN